MRKQYQLLSCFLFISVLCSAQVKYWASNMRLYPLDSCKLRSVQLSIGIGISRPTEATRTSLNALNTRDFMANVYLPIQVNKPSKHNRFDYGIHLGFTYALGYGKYVESKIRPYNINNQTQAPALTVRETGSTSHVISRFEIGPQFNLHFDKFSFSSIFTFGFVHLQRGSYEVVQTTNTTNAAGLDTTLRFNLYAADVKRSYGMAFLPKQRLSYAINRLSIWSEVQYTWGPSVGKRVATFVPQGLPSPSTGNYTIDQIRLGATNSTSERVNYQSWGFRLGVSFKLSIPCPKPRSKCGCK